MSKKSLADLAAASPEEQRAHFRAHAELITLLKAMYFFGAVFVDSIVIAATGGSRASLKAFIDAGTHGPLERLDLSRVLRAYTVAVFRHKFVAHPELPRFVISELRPGGPIRLTPTSSGSPTFPPEDLTSLAELSCRYDPSMPTLTTNPYECVSALFYGIPIGSLGARTPERRRIDAIAERTLCRSLDRVEIVAALDSFVRAVDVAVK